jgi:hypothetical protein
MCPIHHVPPVNAYYLAKRKLYNSNVYELGLHQYRGLTLEEAKKINEMYFEKYVKVFIGHQEETKKSV